MKQSNLSKRVEKAKELTYSHSSYAPGKYQTWGSKDSEYGQKYYRITLSKKMETIITPDSKKNILTILVDCQRDTGNGQPCNCPGNERHTVCYHGLGALYNSFKDSGKLISFFETYESAIKTAFGGKIVKVQSVNGKGFVWAIIKDWPVKHKLVAKTPLEAEVKIVDNEEELFNFQKEIIATGLKKGILSVKENIDLMRGSENDEGID